MNRLIMAILFTMAFTQGSFAAEGGSGTTGGGETVDVNGRPALRDLVDSANCFWYTGEDFGNSLEYYPAILSAIENVHWYLALSYRTEAERLRVCMTSGDLKQVPTEDKDSVTIVEDRQRHQVAVRINDQIFIDGETFEKMDKIDQSYLFFHEVTHSFIPMKTERRNAKLRSFVAATARHMAKPLSAAEFGLQIEMNSLEIISSATQLDSFRGALTTIVDRHAEIDFRKAAAIKVSNDKVFDVLRSAEKSLIQALVKQAGEEYLQAVNYGDLEGVKHAIFLGVPYSYTPSTFESDALTSAVNAKNAEIVEYLVSLAPSDTSWINGRFGSSPLNLAIENGDFGSVSALLRAKAMVVPPSALPNAISRKNNEMIMLLLSHPSTNLNSSGAGSNSPMLVAVNADYPFAIKALLQDRRLEVEQIEAGLKLAIDEKRVKALRVLLRARDFDPNSLLDDGRYTLLMYAVKNCFIGFENYEIIRLISFSDRVDLSVKNVYGYDVFGYVADRTNYDTKTAVLKILKEAKAYKNSPK